MRMLRDLRELQRLRKNPIGYLAATRTSGRDRSLLAVPGARIHLLFTPGAAQRVLLEQHGRYGRCALVFNKIRPLTGLGGLVQLEGGAWKTLRQRYARMFTANALEASRPSFAQAADRALARLAPTGGTQRIDIVEIVTSYVLENALRLFAGIDAGSDDSRGQELAERFLDLNRRCGARMLSPFTLPSLKTAALRRALDRQVDAFLETSPLASEGMPPSQLRDQVKTFLFAGHETTTSSIVSTLHLLGQHPYLQDLARSLAGPERERFLRNAYNEALRLYPPAWLLVRTALADDAEWGIAKGDHVFLAVREIHRHPDYWERPEEFRPDRFNGQETKPRVPGQFIPYGAGPKMCIGQKLAPLEAVALIDRLLDRFHIDATMPIAMTPHITLFPAGPVWLTLRRLNRGGAS